MTQILAFAGTKQSGKTSGAHFVSAYVISQIGRMNKDEPMFRSFAQNEQGKIVIPLDNGNDSGIFNFSRSDEEFAKYAETYIWPYIKVYSFANPLKELCVDLFNIPYDQIYGSDAQKNLPTQYKWEDVPYDTGKTGFMSGRDFMQEIGTGLFRSLYDTIWIDKLLKSIDRDGSDIAVIDDCRFLNEVNVLKNRNSLIIKLDRDFGKDKHKSENEIRNADKSNFDLVIGKDVSLEEKNQEILNFLYEKKWFTSHIPLERFNANIVS